MGAIIAGAGIAAAGAIGGGILSSSAAKKASAKQNKILKAFLAEEKRRNAVVEANLQPFVDVSHKALNNVSGLGGPKLPSLVDLDYFGFQRDEAERQTRRALSVRGNLYSGAGIEAEQRAIADLTGRTKQREQDLYLSLATLGQNSAAQQGSIGAQSLASAGNVSSNIGNSIANLTATRGQALAGAVTGSTGAIGGALVGYGSNQQLLSLLQTQPARQQPFVVGSSGMV